jgi:UDP-3-O-acyl-N-acetylglucosamine deacetylase
MTRIQVTCATVEQGRYVTHLGGSVWRKPVEHIKGELAIHLHNYYVIVDGQEVPLKSVIPMLGLALFEQPSTPLHPTF